jgi:hypothetical protein
MLDAFAEKASAVKTLGPNDPAAASPTPLLDSVTERVAAVTREHQESLLAADPPAAPSKILPAPTVIYRPGAQTEKPVASVSLVALPSEPKASVPAAETQAPQRVMPPPAAAPTPPASQTVTSRPDDPPLPSPNPTASRPEPSGPLPPPSDPKRDAAAPDPRAASSHAEALEQEPAADEPLTVSEPRLCQKVHGFGSYELLGDPAVRAGQRLLIYSDVSGLRYEESGDAFTSQISSRLELRSQADGLVRWETALGPKQDSCRRRRRDFYVNYLVQLPAALEPGPYRLRLTLTDLIAGRDASSEVPLEIAR